MTVAETDPPGCQH